MIRSFDYAVETARKGSAEADGHAVSAERLRHAFLEGYLGAASAAGAAFLPRDRDAVLAWVRFFELEKALYELEYEVDNRPGWVHIPLGGVLRLLRTAVR
jgi:maltose alpha-D-glucosyltransferase/alpha-amylase